jgi:hypothetical protein
MNKIKVNTLPVQFGDSAVAFLTSSNPQKAYPMSTNNTMRSFSMRLSGLRLSHYRLSTCLHSSAWPGLVLILVALGLLWSFYKVTHDFVQQSELRWQTISVYNKATWHCKSLGDRTARENCLSQREVIAGEISARLP